MHERKIAGFFRQITIILWKNAILFSRNISGLICELLFSISSVLLFLVLVYYIVPQYEEKTEYRAENPIQYAYDDDVNNSTLFYFYPNNDFIKQIVLEAKDKLSYTTSSVLKVVPYDKPDPYNITDKQAIYAFVSFPSSYVSLDSLPDKLDYKIYTKESSKFSTYHTDEILLPKSKYQYDDYPESFCSKNEDRKYVTKYTTFNSIKHSIDLALLNLASTIDFYGQIQLRQFSCPDYTDNLLKSKLSFMITVLISLAFMVTFLVTVSSIIVEKETKMKEYLRLIGVNPMVIWFCWLFRSFIVYLLITLIITFAGTKQFVKEGFLGKEYVTGLFLFTNPILVFFTCIVYSIQISCLSLLVGQIFRKTFAAKTVSIIVWFVTMINFYNSFPTGIKYVFAILPNTALNFAFQIIFQYERNGKYLDFSKMYKSLYEGDMTLGTLLAFMLLWSAFYLILSWYIERINPGDYGVKLPLYFPFMRSYWFENKNFDEDLDDPEENMSNSDAFEREPADLYASVKIKKLTKKFTTAFEEKTVVNNVSLNFYENQITGFLGHNGAGKTTVTFMLCGLYSPSSGTAKILGHDIRTHMDKIRSSIGFCPQANILFDELTVSQHLDLVASIKGFPRGKIRSEIHRIASYVGLQGDLNKKSKELSGGMKRRLSVAMALIGDSKVIILDEPTSGLDPFNRRTLWELIRNYKNGRTIILTTHYMEEADALSDRIALMNHGQVKCCGSPLFLKDKFGSGYRLILTKNSEFKQNKLESLIRKVTQAEPTIESNIAREICVSIPTYLSTKLPHLLNELEKKKNELGIINYGISSSTVEEVFIKIGSIDADEDLFDSKKDRNKSQFLSSPNADLSNAFSRNQADINTGLAYKLQQIKSLFVKRSQIFIRRYMIAIFTILLPIVLQAVLASIIPSASSIVTSTLNNLIYRFSIPEYELTLANYSNHILLYKINSTNQAEKDKFRKAFLEFETDRYANSKMSIQEVTGEESIDNYLYAKRKQDVNNLVSNFYMGVEFRLDESDKFDSVAYYSNFAYHSSASILNEINSFYLSSKTSNRFREIRTINAPIAVSKLDESDINTEGLQLIDCFESIPFSFLDFINGIIIAFVISLTTIHIVREKRNGSKSLQLLSGTHYSIYWISNYLFDMCVYFVTISLMILALKIVALSSPTSTNDTNILAYKGSSLFYLFVFMVLTCVSWATLSYIWSNLFQSDIIAFVVLFIILAFATLLDMVFVLVGFFTGSLFSNFTQNPVNTAMQILRTVFSILFPNIAVKRAIFNLKLQNTPVCIQVISTLSKSNMTNATGFEYAEPGIGKFLLFNYINVFCGLVLLFLIESQFLSTLYYSFVEKSFKKQNRFDKIYEEDVGNEAQRLKYENFHALTKKEPIVVRDLLKIFKKSGKTFSAVNNLSFGVQPTECFGLLGLNGAGKTTTIEILTGQKRPSDGKAYLNGFDISSDRMNAIKSLGFCPQFDYLPEYLTVKQSLELFLNLRGVKGNIAKMVLKEFMNAFKLNEFENKLVQNLSGGNKRKVSSAIAFIGMPQTVILDEPTSGMDPAARRYLWNVIKKARDEGMTILLTTHSMEECEALCTKLAIMVNGQFQCFGNIQHLKSKYGKGYSLILKCKAEIETGDISIQRNLMYINNAESFVARNIPNAILKDKQQQTLFYQIILSNESQQNTLNIAQIFNLIETNKDHLNLETYSLSQTSLEQVFLNFARKQMNEVENPSDVVINMVGNNQLANQSNRFRTPHSNSFENKSFSKETTIPLKDL